MATSTLGSGTLVLAGTTSGTTTVTATAVAGTTTLTLPAATDTLVGKATTDTLTNKTLTTPTISQLSSAAATALTLQSAGTTAVTIDTSQNVGIGTSSPTQKLHVNSAGSAIGLFQSTLAAGNTNVETRYISTNRTWGVGQNIIQTSSIFEIADITANATRLAIDSSGNLLVGTTSSSSRKAYFKGGVANNQCFTFDCDTAQNNYVAQFFISGQTPNNNTSRFLTCTDLTADRAYIYSNGGIANYSANNVNLSDRREKTNFAPAGSYLDKICAVPVQTFNYIDQNLEDDAGLTLGVVAQDVQAVAPELVTESNWGTEEEPKLRLSIYQTDLQYALMKCIQEMKSIIDDQSARIATLEAK